MLYKNIVQVNRNQWLNICSSPKLLLSKKRPRPQNYELRKTLNEKKYTLKVLKFFNTCNNLYEQWIKILVMLVKENANKWARFQKRRGITYFFLCRLTSNIQYLYWIFSQLLFVVTSRRDLIFQGQSTFRLNKLLMLLL